MAANVKGFYSFTAEDLSTNLPKGTYHLKIKESSVGEWPDSREKLDITTEVVSGAFAGKYGPRHTWSVETADREVERTDGSGTFTISAEKTQAMLAVQIQSIMNGLEIVLSNPTSFDGVMLREIASQIKGREFIANVTQDKNGYPRMGRVYSMSTPPKSFKGAEVTNHFSVDEI